MALTYHGHKLANIWPLKSKNGARADDPLYRFHRLATKVAKPLTDRQIDQLVFGC